jgi:hypothetical protein
MQPISIHEIAQQIVPPVILVYSTEGDIYTASALLVNGQKQVICYDDGKLVRTASLDDMHSIMSQVDIQEAYLVTRSPYDEMIGTETFVDEVKTNLHWS